MKKWYLPVVLALLLVVALTAIACNGEEATTTTAAPTTTTAAPTTTTAAPTTTVAATTATTAAAAGASSELGIFFKDQGNNVVKITNVPFAGASFDVTTEGAYASKIEAFGADGKSLGTLELPEAAAGVLDYSKVADKVAKLVVTDMEGKVFEYLVP
jgi:hypothetical protein